MEANAPVVAPIAAACWLRLRAQAVRVFALVAVAISSGCCSVKTTGYLAKGPPTSLQFAPPVRYASLPPLPRPADTQPPVPTPEVSDTPQASAVPPASQIPTLPARSSVDSVGSAPTAAFSGTGTNQQPAKIELTIQPPGLIPQEVLMRLFPAGRPAGTDAPLGEVFPFQLPAMTPPSSTATYEVK